MRAEGRTECPWLRGRSLCCVSVVVYWITVGTKGNQSKVRARCSLTTFSHFFDCSVRPALLAANNHFMFVPLRNYPVLQLALALQVGGVGRRALCGEGCVQIIPGWKRGWDKCWVRKSLSETVPSCCWKSDPDYRGRGSYKTVVVGGLQISCRHRASLQSKLIERSFKQCCETEH